MELTSIKPTSITSFKGEYRWLSNFWNSPIQAGTWRFPTAEHAYQAMKSLNPFYWLQISECSTPGSAKRLGQKVRLRDDWEAIKVDCMREVISCKFEYPDLREKLLATGDALLIEGNTWGDTFWGVCNGEGQNMLGQLLMEERARIYGSLQLNQEPEDADRDPE